MAVTFTNILVGEATLSVDGVDVGATQDGVEISWEPNMVDIEIDQYGDAARVVQSMAKVYVRTTLAEGTLRNLALSWGYKTSGATSTQPGVQNVSGGTQTFNFGTHGVYPEEHVITFTGNAPGSTATVTKTRTYTNYRAIQYTTSAHSLQRADNVKLPCEFRILPDATLTGREYGTIVDQV